MGSLQCRTFRHNDNIRRDIKEQEVMWMWIHLAVKGELAGFCKRGNKTLGSKRDKELSDG
jgi:hypothetical protein